VIVSYIEKVSCEVHQNEKMPRRRSPRAGRRRWRDARGAAGGWRASHAMAGAPALAARRGGSPASYQATRRGGGGSAGIGAERITVTGIIVNISKQHAKTSHGINIAVDDCKTQGIEREKFRKE
jgi:hypothetical protein